MLCVTRHGQTPWNVEDKICGQVEVPLTSLGREQAAAAGATLAEEGVAFDRIIASPLERAQETACIIAREVGFPAERIETDPRLIERAFGDYEGIPMDSELYKGYKTQFAFACPGGESILRMAGRVYPLLDELEAQAAERAALGAAPENILLVCHGAVSRVIASYFESMTNEEFVAWSVGNAQVNAYPLG